MKNQEELKKFRWLFFLLVPAFAVTINLLLFGENYYLHWNILIFSTALLLLLTLLLSSLQIALANWMRKRVAREDKLITRLLIFSCLSVPLTASFVTLIFVGYDALSLFGYQFSINSYKWGLFTGLVCDIIGTAMNESIFGYSKWKETKLHAEQLSKEKLQTQLNGLLQQINPHFLFNSLNSLSALIAEDQKKAQQFVSDLSKVYRYLLRTNETELTTLATELQFIDSYFHLLQTRFGGGVQLEKKIESDATSVYVPPLTLQLLVENAVKHNTVSKSKPLRIEIIATNDILTVRNNLQKKSLKVESSKIGLSNISEKYRLINKTTIDISESNGYFSVAVPLIRAL